MSMSFQEELQTLSAGHIAFLAIGMALNLFIMYRLYVEFNILFGSLIRLYKSKCKRALQNNRLIKTLSIPEKDDKPKFKATRAAHA